MRRKFLGLAIIAMSAIGPSQAFAGDREIAEQIIQRLQTSRDSGALKNFTLDMKVDKGVVLFRGSVADQSQKNLVLKAANGLSGIDNVVDQLTIKPSVVQPTSKATAEPEFTLRDALAAEVQQIMSEDAADAIAEPGPTTIATAVLPKAAEPIAVAAPAVEMPARSLAPQEVVPGEVRPTAAYDTHTNTDQRIVSDVVRRLSQAQKSGTLKGFGVDVKCQGGVLSLKGRAADSAQRARIVQLAESVPGIQRVRNSIQVATPAAPVPAPALPQPPALSTVAKQAKTRLSPVSVDPVAAPLRTNMQPMPAVTQVAPAPYRAPQMGQPLQAQPVHSVSGPAMGAPMMGTPVPMNGYGGAIGAPRYDSPNLPNYAWPGYAAYPNYAALTYPQQYSPSAWPYIGPFYPYPQVPLGWRKVSLEWDDGWWQLDFTDR